MHYTRITGLERQVSTLCLGTMRLVEDQQAFPLFDAYVDHGGNFIDTANVYGKHVKGYAGGDSELLIGRWLAQSGKRDQLVLASKVGVVYQDAEAGLSKEQIITECERSLKRLGVDHIDIYYLHNDFREYAVDEVLQAIDALQQSGKIGILGASSFAAWRMETYYQRAQQLNCPSIAIIQERHSYFRPRPDANFGSTRYVTDEISDWCKERQVAITAYAPLLRGIYGNPNKNWAAAYQCADNQARLACLQELAKDLQVSPNCLALAWMMQAQPQVIPVIGVSSEAQLSDNVQATQLALDEASLLRLSEAGEDLLVPQAAS